MRHGGLRDRAVGVRRRVRNDRPRLHDAMQTSPALFRLRREDGTRARGPPRRRGRLGGRGDMYPRRRRALPGGVRGGGDIAGAVGRRRLSATQGAHAVRFRRRAREAVEGVFDHLAPRPFPRPPFSFPAANDQAVLGAGHGDIEQTPVFLAGARPCGVDPLDAERVAIFGADRPQQLAAVRRPHQLRVAPGNGRRVGQVDHRRFHALGAVHGRDTHRVVLRRGVAFDLDAAGRQPMQKPLKARRVGALIGERLGEEFVEGVVRLGAETGAEAPPPAARREQIGVKFPRRRPVGAGEKFAQTLPRIGAKRVRIRHGDQAPPKRLFFPAVREREQRLVVEAEQRALQRFREAQVVVGKQQETPEGHQVHDRDVFGEDHPVDAGDRHPGFLELARQFVDEAPAAADQHQNIARPRRPAAAFEHVFAVAERGDALRHPFRELVDRVGRGDAFDRGFPRRRFVGRPGFDRLPQFDAARLTGPPRVVAHGTPVEDDSPAGVLVGEHCVHRRQNRGRRAERSLQRRVVPALPGAARATGEPPLHLRKFRRVGALEAVDRLFRVADREHGARPPARPFAGEELVGKRPHHLPLFGVRVLRLVDEQVVEAAVEFVEHPRRAAPALQQGGCVKDEIVEIEPRERSFPRFVGVDDRPADGQQRRCRRRDRRAFPVLDGARDPRLLGLDDPFEFRFSPQHRHGRDLFAGFVLRRQERAAIVVEAGDARVGVRGDPAADRRAALRIARPPLRFRHGRRQRAKPVLVARAGGAGGAHRVFGRGPARDADGFVRPFDQRIEAAGLADGAAQTRALSRQFAEQVGHARLMDVAHHHPERVAQRLVGRGDRGALHRVHRFAGLPFVEDLEPGRRLRLERKPPQQRLAEGVQRHDGHAAGRVEHPRQQAPRRVARGRLRRRAQQRFEFALQIRLFRHRPAGETVVQAVGHLRRRGGGKGQTKDALRRRPADQEAEDAVDQHLGFARPRRGVDPCRSRRVRRLALGRIGGGHGSAPPELHSPTRARCS